MLHSHVFSFFFLFLLRLVIKHLLQTHRNTLGYIMFVGFVKLVLAAAAAAAAVVVVVATKTPMIMMMTMMMMMMMMSSSSS